MFDAAVRGTSAADWAADERFAALPPLDLEHVRRVVVVAAHPDDESLGAGGLIARMAERGILTEVIIVTDGRGSHPHSTTHDPDHVAVIRRAETLVAVGEISWDATVTFLDIPDGETGSFRDEIRLRVAARIGEGAHTLLVSHLRQDGHRDHREVGEIAALAAAESGATFVEFPIWMWHWGSPDTAEVPWRRMRRLDLTEAERAAKQSAIEGHRSQVVGLSRHKGDGPMLRPDFVEHFETGVEVFVVEDESAKVPGAPLSRSYFENLYERRDDPWSFETRWYEKRKRAVTIAALPEEKFGSALELGCSIGLLTEALAERCTELLAVDISAAAVKRARKRLAGKAGVTIKRRDVASEFPSGRYDLVVLSEVGYYLDQRSLDELIDHITDGLAAGGTLIACHWRHAVEDYPLSGDAVHAAIRSRSGLASIVQHLEADFILEVFSADSRSVAERTGLL
jgi:LmbE family N-acetylglucosaminyl deacetylase/SAM-dependent methyltransferase